MNINATLLSVFAMNVMMLAFTRAASTSFGMKLAPHLGVLQQQGYHPQLLLDKDEKANTFGDIERSRHLIPNAAAAITTNMAHWPFNQALRNLDEFETPTKVVNDRHAEVYDPGDELMRILAPDLLNVNSQESSAAAASAQSIEDTDTEYTDAENGNKYEILQKLEKDLRDDQDIISKSALLMKLLEDPTIQTLPVVYVEEALEEVPTNALIDADNTIEDDNTGNGNNLNNLHGNGIAKRGRYYRRYTWKRHSRNRSSSNYEPELRYACTPSKEDVFKLLLNLHENRKGKQSKTVNFCNRKRPAKAIFTNIRFLG